MTTTDRIDQMECPECLGAGHDGDRQCPTCDGCGCAPLGEAKQFLQEAHTGAGAKLSTQEVRMISAATAIARVFLAGALPLASSVCRDNGGLL